MKITPHILQKVDTLNILLILISLILSFVLPFSLFLVSYAILGPLHYLTEINWLNDKNYFIQQKGWIWFFILMAFVISIPPLSNLPIFIVGSKSIFPEKLIYFITGYTDVILLTLLLFAFGVVFLKKQLHVFLFLVACFIIGKVITKYVLGSYILVGIFLPTIVHVFVFTFLFMFLGALNSGSKSGWISLILLAISPLIIYFISIPASLYAITESIESINTAKNFRFINYLAERFNALENGRINSLSTAGLKIQTFIAFCYTYHYLNWFAKTSVIGWRKNMTTKKLSVILGIWIAAIALFMYNYELAYLALFFLTILHIVLEFPLNIISIKEIGLNLKKRFSI